MARRQAAAGGRDPQGPDVVSLSSFIGVDGSNITLNSGRMLINLKPVNDRSASASDIIRRLQQETADVTGISLYMQPVQDLSIDTTRQPHPVPVRARGRQPGGVHHLGAAAGRARCSSCRSSRMSPATRRTRGCRPTSPSTATPPARFGITPATVDNALYDAFGQRIVSTIFTQSNQYRVILQADSSLMASLDSLGTIYLPSATAVGGQVPLSALVKVSTPHRAAVDRSPRPVPRDHHLVQPRHRAQRSAMR